MSSNTPRRSVDIPTSPPSLTSPNQYPFPQYNSPPRPGSGTRYQSRRTSTASSITSIGGILDVASQGRDSSIAETGNNAISTLLQPPILRTGLLPHTSGPGAQKPPSTKDISPVTLTNIPHIDNIVFRPYLAQAGSLYEAFRRAKDGHDDGRPHLSSKITKGDSASTNPGSYGAQVRASALSSLTRLDTSVLTSIAPLEAPTPKRRTSGGVGRRAGVSVAPLSTIPPVYSEPDFRLENPRTFDIVSERSEIVRPPSSANGSATMPVSTGKKELAANAILQEKLSWYMDTVEIHLISSISSASTSFFAALGSLRELHSEAAQSVNKIKTLRQDLVKLDHDMAVGGLKVVAMRKRRENMRKLGDAVDQLREVVESVTRCEEQVDKGEIEEALKGLSNVEGLIAGDATDFSILNPTLASRKNLTDLRGIKALEGAGNDIALLRKRIGKAFEGRFIDTLLRDIHRHIDDVPSGKTFQRWDQASSRFRAGHVRTPTEFPAYLHIESGFRSALLAQLKGLARSDSVMPAAIAYRDAILREFKSIIRRHLPSSSDDDVESTTSIATQESRHMSQQEKSSILARNLRALDPEDAEEMFKRIYSNVGEALRRLGTQVKVLLDITSSLGNPHPHPPMRSPPLGSPSRSPQLASISDFLSAEPSPGPPPSAIKQEEIQQALDLSSLLGQAVDIAQAQIVKIIKVRTEQSTNLDLPYFLRYFTLNRLFADECEAVSGRGGMAFKTVVNDHIKAFVNHVGEIERQKLVQSMDADTWDAKDFTNEANTRLSRILEASTRDVDVWTKSSLLWEDGATKNGQPQSNGPTANGVVKDKLRSALIDEQKYILPESATAVSRGIEAFEHLLTGIPSMTQEICALLLEYLKLFNSRSSQLILGAGATRSAGLKNITTKHLALSSQALSFVIALIPHIREFVRRHTSNSGNLMVEFDKVKRLFQEHQSGIHDKLVDIMSGRAAAHVSTMKRIKWDQPMQKEAVNGYMDTLIKETTTLHKVLSKHLPEMTVQMIMYPVIESYKDLWGKAYKGVEVTTPEGKERLLRDVEFFKGRINKLDGAGDIGDYLLRIINDKSVESGSKAVEHPPDPIAQSTEHAHGNGASENT